MITANFNLKGKSIALSWTDKDKLKTLIGEQNGFFDRTLQTFDDDFFISKIEGEYLRLSKFIVDNVTLPNNPTVIDIGSGASVTDLVLYAYLDQKAKFYLVDGANGGIGSNILHNENFRPFNTWEPVIDAIATNQFNPDDFTLLSTNHDNNNAQWQDIKVDMVISTGAYGLHFPMKVYWEKIVKILKPGGYLVISPMVDIGNQLEFVSTAFGKPILQEEITMERIKTIRPNDFLKWEKLMPTANEPGAIWGWRVIWQRPV